MKRRFLLFVASSILCCCLSISCNSNKRATSPASQDIIVLYENDVHCGVDGYANFAALKNEMKPLTSMSPSSPMATLSKVEVWAPPLTAATSSTS